MEPLLILKLDLLPSIAQEVEQISADYVHLCEEVRKGNKQAYQDLIILQARLRGRIEDFDRFYDRNYADYRIGYFEKMKLRLRKLISPHIDVNRLIYEETHNYNQQSSPIKNITPPHKVAENSPSPIKMIVQQQQIRNTTDFVQQQEIKQQAAPKTAQSPKKISNIVNKKNTKKMGKQMVKKDSRTKASQDELIFTIKMSKEEYMQYIQAKSNKR